MASAPKNRKLEANGSQIEEEEFIKKIDQIQMELDKVNEQASEEILEVEKKINQKRQPLYSERAKLIMTISNFWLTALRNHPALSSLISVKDNEVLHFLTNLEVDEFDDIKSGFQITLTFSENPFFTNTKISKSIHVGESELKTQCDRINWKEGRDFVTALAASEEKQAASGLTNGNGALGGPQLPKSFMLWFTSTKSESMVELGEVLKDDLWPNPLQYFFANETFDDDEDDEEPEDDDEEEEDEEDEEGQEEENDEDLGDDEEDGE